MEKHVTNAGLVLLNRFIKLYFDRIGLTDGDKFKSQQAQLDAVHWLQFLVTGQSKTEEHKLALNKVICGLPLSCAVPKGIEISDEGKQLAEGLINTVIGYWPSCGSSSIDGFRGNWLVRDGRMSESDNCWTLNVEKKPYDLLLNKAPFSFSTVGLPFMIKPLCVDWPT